MSNLGVLRVNVGGSDPSQVPIWTMVADVARTRQLFYRHQLPGQWTDPGFDSELLRSMMDPNVLPRVLICNENSDLVSLEHPYPVIAHPQHQLQVKNCVGLRAGDVVAGIFGTILSGGSFQNWRLSDDQFLLKVAFIDEKVKDLKISVPHPNGIDYLYRDSPIGGSYVFAKHQISYCIFGTLALPVMPSFFLNRNGFQPLQSSE